MGTARLSAALRELRRILVTELPIQAILDHPYRDSPIALSSESIERAETPADVAAACLANAQARAELPESSDRSRDAALHDALTGLPNRALLLERLDHDFLRARRTGHTPAVLFLDIEEFKAVKDTHGHPSATICWSLSSHG